MVDPLTSDNLLLSEPSPASFGMPSDGAINCATSSTDVADLVWASIAHNTRRAYASDLNRFVDWGGSIPSTPQLLAFYLAEHANSHSVATLARWVVSIGKAHRAAGYCDPTKSELVASVLQGIRRTRGVVIAQARPLMRDDLLLTLDAMDNTLKSMRDRALLLMGFAGGFRRSELTALDVEDIQPVRQGVVLHVRKSKTDQDRRGRKIGVPHAQGRHCPVIALETWISAADITDGPLFRAVSRHQHVAKRRLSAEAVSIIIRQSLEAAGMSGSGYSGHSLRAGFATSAAQVGVSSWNIRQQTGHASDAMLARYIRMGELFTNNAAGALL